MAFQKTARKFAEQPFGIIFKRFRLLDRASLRAGANFRSQLSKMVIAAVILHNMCVDENDIGDDFEDVVDNDDDDDDDDNDAADNEAVAGVAHFAAADAQLTHSSNQTRQIIARYLSEKYMFNGIGDIVVRDA
jgi:hypothetical protein